MPTQFSKLSKHKMTQQQLKVQFGTLRTGGYVHVLLLMTQALTILMRAAVASRSRKAPAITICGNFG